MEGAFGELRDALNAELLTQLKSVSPAFFESLVVQLLVKMEYGGSIEDAGKAVGRSGDGGIDGVIKEDKLGLDSIFVQAKRWENNVGSGPVREFIGSLTVKRARKGVFLTTARFSPEAKECVKGLDQHIVLVDGERLASLMIENEVGVTLAQSYRVMKLDQDFFDE
ncbi:MAG: restriction endonuclease [Bryobacteraceae bacterium]|nr:restriction endonuclease [Bryobacteraceae bacterium]